MFLRTLTHRAVPSEGELTYWVFTCVDLGASALAHEAGVLHTVYTEWSEESGPGAVISLSSDELVEQAQLRLIDVGSSARTVAHIARGEHGFREEVARQYNDLEHANRGSVQRDGDVWGMLVRGKRYRVHSSFVDLDGTIIPGASRGNSRATCSARLL